MHRVHEERSLRAVADGDGWRARHRLLPVSRAGCDGHKISRVFKPEDLQNHLWSQREHALPQYPDARLSVWEREAFQGAHTGIDTRPRATKARRGVQDGSLFGFVQVDIEVPVELYDRFSECLRCSWQIAKQTSKLCKVLTFG